MDREICHFNYNSKHHDKCKLAVKLIRHLAVSNLFPLEFVQKCQYCQLCVLRENSSHNVRLGSQTDENSDLLSVNLNATNPRPLPHTHPPTHPEHILPVVGFVTLSQCNVQM